MSKILLITPPFVQVNAPYPATAYLKGYLKRKGIEAEQYDLSIELIGEIFSNDFLNTLFDLSRECVDNSEDDNIKRIYALRKKYSGTIDSVMKFLRTNDSALANLICTPEFTPQGSRFENITDLEASFGQLGTVDCAKYISTLYLQDLCDFIRTTVTPHFEMVRYAEKISLSIPQFSVLAEELAKPLNIIEEKMIELLQVKIEAENPEYIGFTVPFPGNLLSALRCAQYIKERFPAVKTIMGGGYPSTELRNLTDSEIFHYFDYIALDDGEASLEKLLATGKPDNMFTSDSFHAKTVSVSHTERGCPDFSHLPHDKYISLCEVTNPMHRLWSDGRWNKMMTAHGCYWAKCAFCDTSLDYIKCYSAVSASTFVDWMQEVARQTGSFGFHFTDEAASPKMLKEISLEILKRGIRFSWWTNIRFENAYTGDLCQLMAAAGCIAVSGGLEVASDRLLKVIDKGVDIEQATIVLRNFYYSGIMVHTYLMYGFPTQTLQESIDSLEVVRQLFRAELIGSAYWHRYAMTMYSPSGIEPEKFGVRRKNTNLNLFANNEVYFAEDRGYNINLVGDALRESLANYMAGHNIDRPAHKWFAGKVQPTVIENSLITDHLIKPDSSRIFNENARLVWIGGEILRTNEGIEVHGASAIKAIKLPEHDADFMVEITAICANLTLSITFTQARDIYAKHTTEPFSILYHSKKWDILRGFGLLQL